MFNVGDKVIGILQFHNEGDVLVEGVVDRISGCALFITGEDGEPYCLIAEHCEVA